MNDQDAKMTCISVKVFGAYLIAVGIAFAAAPDLLLMPHAGTLYPPSFRLRRMRASGSSVLGTKALPVTSS